LNTLKLRMLIQACIFAYISCKPLRFIEIKLVWLNLLLKTSDLFLPFNKKLPKLGESTAVTERLHEMKNNERVQVSFSGMLKSSEFNPHARPVPLPV